MHHPRIRLRRPDKRQQANHAELVRYHPRGNVRHPACSETTPSHEPVKRVMCGSQQRHHQGQRCNHHSRLQHTKHMTFPLNTIQHQMTGEVSPSGNTWIPFFWLLFCAEAVLSPGNLGPSALDVLLLVEFKFYKWGRQKRNISSDFA